MIIRLQIAEVIKVLQYILNNVRGEPVFSVMAASWFCEKSGRIGKVEDVEPVLLNKIGF